MPLTIKRRVTPADAKRWWARTIAGCNDADIAMLSDATYWNEVKVVNEAAAKAGDATAREAIADAEMFELYRPTLDEQNTTLRGTWVRGADGEWLVKTSTKARPGDVVTVMSTKGQSRRYTLVEKTSEGWTWKGR